MSFKLVLSALSAQGLQVEHRSEGIAFFKTARTLYAVEAISYFCINIPTGLGIYSHCAYSDSEALNCLSHYPFDHRVLADCYKVEDERSALRNTDIPIRTHATEVGRFQVTMRPGLPGPEAAHFLKEFKILANYFHTHVLRMNGHNVERSMLVSAKELDCLKWTASGKTAWEASVILGISERTVRFHLNAAREKLNCSTTTQAVAKAIANQLIDV
jgi:DNA-binding CsgD family transcriptional regulator